MRILAWNLNHRSRRRAIPVALAAGILSVRPDVVVLTEYVEGPDHDAFCGALEKGGMFARFQTPLQSGHNQVLLASRLETARKRLIPPDTPPSPTHAVSNCLRVWLASPSLDLVGLRVPAYTRAADKRCYWDWFERAIRPLFAHRSVIIGDFNFDPWRSSCPGPEHIRRLMAVGWQLPRPTGRGSYFSPTGHKSRLDHALVSPSVMVSTAKYITKENGDLFAGVGRACFSDHAPLILDVIVP